MRGGNSLKNPIIAGLIAGFASGIVATIFRISGFNEELFSIHPYYSSVPVNMQTIGQVEIIWGIIWGIIFTAFYALFYNYIPGKGIKKGLNYGIIVWAIAIFRQAIIGAVYGYYQLSIIEAIVCFFSVGITYGLLIGILYKKE